MKAYRKPLLKVYQIRVGNVLNDEYIIGKLSDGNEGNYEDPDAGLAAQMLLIMDEEEEDDQSWW